MDGEKLRSASSADSIVERAGLLAIMLRAGPSTRALGAMSGARKGTTSVAARLLKDRCTLPARYAHVRVYVQLKATQTPDLKLLA